MIDFSEVVENVKDFYREKTLPAFLISIVRQVKSKNFLLSLSDILILVVQNSHFESQILISQSEILNLQDNL